MERAASPRSPLTAGSKATARSFSRSPTRRSSAASSTSSPPGRTVAHDPAEAVELPAANGADRAGRRRLDAAGTDGGHRFSLRDLRFGDPSKPGARAQERLLSKAPERCRIVVGEPAAVDDLRARWERHSGEAGDGEGFTRFVARQARLAVDRAERSLLGARYKSAHDIVEDLLASRDFRTGAQALGAKLGRDTDSVIDEAREYLTELASVQNRFARDVWSRSKFLWGRAYRMEVDHEALERLRELNPATRWSSSRRTSRTWTAS